LLEREFLIEGKSIQSVVQIMIKIGLLFQISILDETISSNPIRKITISRKAISLRASWARDFDPNNPKKQKVGTMKRIFSRENIAFLELYQECKLIDSCEGTEGIIRFIGNF